MSRARPIDLPGEIAHSLGLDDTRIWFDVHRNGEQATAEQLELLVIVTGDELDDLLDADVTQGALIRHLRRALDQGCIPADVAERQKAYRLLRKQAPECRACGMPGNSTRHHFVNKWIMKELSNYPEVGARPRCTIPLCIECHRDLHDRHRGEAVSIVGHLVAAERRFASDLIERLRRERPGIFRLLSQGAPETYEARLVRDWMDGLFDR